METVRGLAVGLGPALLGSFGSPLLWRWSLGGEISATEFRAIAGFGIVTLLFTVPGSVLLSLVFAWSGGRSIPLLARYVLIVVTGGSAAAVMMLGFGTMELIRTGVAYGLVTAICWIGLHLAIYRGR